MKTYVEAIYDCRENLDLSGFIIGDRYNDFVIPKKKMPKAMPRKKALAYYNAKLQNVWGRDHVKY